MEDWHLLVQEEYYDDREDTGLDVGSIDNERCIELALSKRWLANSTEPDKVFEIGAVMPYYWECKHEIVDPYDELATIKDFVENIDLSGKEVITISTIEHIGLDEYADDKSSGGANVPEILEENGAVKALQQILKQSSRCFITFPAGYNMALDKWVVKNLHRLNCFGYEKTQRNDLTQWPPVYSPRWDYNEVVEHLDYDYNFKNNLLLARGQRWATFIICIEGWNI